MKKTVILLATLGFMATANAADQENKKEVTVDKTKNPITGTETTTKTTKTKAKGAHSKAESEVTEKTKKKTDGTVEKSIEVEGDAKTH